MLKIVGETGGCLILNCDDPVVRKQLENANTETLRQLLETRLLFGMYPDVITNPGEEKEILKQLTDSFLYKDLLAFQGIRRPDLVINLLIALALQLGNEVSYNELSGLLQVDKKTVSNYIDLLEKAFIIFRLMPYCRNLRTETGKSRKVYFYDNGIRNALTANINPLILNTLHALFSVLLAPRF